MKKTIILMGLSLALVSSSAFAMSDNPSVEVRCFDAPGEQDIRVEVIAASIAGVKRARVYKETFAGDSELGAPIVVSLNDKGMEREYTGSGFDLKIELESMAPTSTHPGQLTLNGDRISLRCTIIK